jgi:hypothetical protein
MVMVPKEAAAAVDIRYVAQHAGPEGHRIQRLAIALVGRLGVGCPHQIIPVLRRQHLARQRHEFMEDLDI